MNEEEFDYPRGVDREMILRTKQEAQEHCMEKMMQNVVEEMIFDYALKIDKIKTVLIGWVCKRNTLTWP